MFERFTDAARRVTNQAAHEAQSSGAEAITSLHILCSAYREMEECHSDLAEIVHKSGVARKDLQLHLKPGAGQSSTIPFTDECHLVLDGAWTRAQEGGEHVVDWTHLLIACITVDCEASHTLHTLCVKRNKLAEVIITWISKQRKAATALKTTAQKKSQPASALQQFCIPLVSHARVGLLSPVLCRDKEVGAVVETLLRKGKNAPLLVGDPGVGKAQPLDALIKIPGGWKMMKDIAVGDEINSHDGGNARVTGVFSQGTRDVYKIVFADGRSTEACAEHLWMVYDKQQSRIVSTQDIIEHMIHDNTWSIPLPKAVWEVCEDTDFDPYVMGCILAGKDVEGVTWDFKESQYLYLSVQQRYSLVQGVMDSKGVIADDGTVTLAGISQPVVIDIQQIIRSLGGTANMGRDKGSLLIRHPQPVKLFRYHLRTHLLNEDIDMTLEIVSVLYSRSSKTQCIRVDNPQHLYITDDYVVTHNTAVVEGLATRIAWGTVPPSLAECEIWTLQMSALVAGTKYRGEFEERMQSLIAEIQSSPHNIIFIDEAHALLGTGAAEGSLDAATILKPLMGRGDARIIGATTWKEYRQVLSRDSALERRFSPVMVHPLDAASCDIVLRALKHDMETHHGITIDDEILLRVRELAERYFPDRHLPDSAIDVLDASCARRVAALDEHPKLKSKVAKANNLRDSLHSLPPLSPERLAAVNTLHRIAEQREKARSSLLQKGVDLDINSVISYISAATGIPRSALHGDGNDARGMRNIDSRLAERVIGQEKATQAVGRALKRAAAGLADEARPLASFLFVGPTGVGKTETARAIADYMPLVRIDMSEYMEKHSASRLIGAAPGYVGYEGGGQLTEALRRNPSCVLLFDEIEKAHPDILHLLLQMCDDGRLTDGQGTTVDCTRAIIIMTSNLGTEHSLKKAAGFTSDAASTSSDIIAKAVKAHLRPELIARLTAVIEFTPLQRPDLEKILKLMLKPTVACMKERYGIRVTINKSMKDLLLDQGFEPALGARPLRLAIQRNVDDNLAEWLLNEEVHQHTKLSLSVVDGICVIV